MFEHLIKGQYFDREQVSKLYVPQVFSGHGLRVSRWWVILNHHLVTHIYT